MNSRACSASSPETEPSGEWAAESSNMVFQVLKWFQLSDTSMENVLLTWE